MERGRPGSPSPQRYPARDPPPRANNLKAVVRLSPPKQGRGENALAGSLEPVAFHRLDLKSFGERIASRGPDRQTAEIHSRIALINRLNALGTAEIERVA